MNAQIERAVEHFRALLEEQLRRVELRFIEHGKRLQMIPVQAKSLSVDTPKDLEYVRAVLREKLRKGEI